MRILFFLFFPPKGAGNLKIEHKACIFLPLFFFLLFWDAVHPYIDEDQLFVNLCPPASPEIKSIYNDDVLLTCARKLCASCKVLLDGNCCVTAEPSGNLNCSLVISLRTNAKKKMNEA